MCAQCSPPCLQMSCIRYSVYGCRAPRHLGGMLSRLAFHFNRIYFGFPLCRWWCVRILLWIVIETRRYGLDCRHRRRPNEKKSGFEFELMLNVVIFARDKYLRWETFRVRKYVAAFVRSERGRKSGNENGEGKNNEKKRIFPQNTYKGMCACTHWFVTDFNIICHSITRFSIKDGWMVFAYLKINRMREKNV